MGSAFGTDMDIAMRVRKESGPARARRARLCRCVGTLRRDESGAAILIVITMVTVGLAVAGVAAVTAANVLRGSTRDESSKDALAAADAGAQIALERQNQVSVNGSFPCVVSAADSLVAGLAGAGNWCPEFTGTAGDANFTYRVRPPEVTELLSRIEIVSTGTSQGVTRRVHVLAESPRATAIFANSTVIGEEFIRLDSNADVFGNAGTNGDIMITSNADLCGSAQYGEDNAIIPADYDGSDCPPTYPYNSAPGNVTLPPIDQGQVADPDFNDNDRIDPSNALSLDTISGNRGSVSWDASNRTLVINSNSALTLGGGDYSFCRLELNSNTALIVAAGASVRIFFDKPENCPTLGAGPQISLDSNSRFTTTDGSPASLQLLVVGSDNPNVTSDDVVLASNSRTTMPVILYSPHSAIELNSNSTLLGAIAGQSVHLDSNAEVRSHADSSSLELPLPLHYRQTQFVECTATGAPAEAPSSDC